jgi:hypothetical protein
MAQAVENLSSNPSTTKTKTKPLGAKKKKEFSCLPGILWIVEFRYLYVPFFFSKV